MVIGRYKTIEYFDAYICTIGRIQVPKGAEFELRQSSSGTKEVYFLNSKNYLPFAAVDTFLQIKREPIINQQILNER